MTKFLLINMYWNVKVQTGTVRLFDPKSLQSFWKLVEMHHHQISANERNIINIWKSQGVKGLSFYLASLFTKKKKMYDVIHKVIKFLYGKKIKWIS